jgi:AcrR family transcriptional regulator
MARNSPPDTLARPRLGPRRRLPIELRRTQVLDAALVLIRDHGYASLSVEAIARQARVSKTVVYNAYGGLDLLLRALLDREETAALASLAHASPVSSTVADPASALAEWLRTLFGAVSENPVTWRLMLLPADGTPPAVRDRVERGREIALAQARHLTAALLAGDPDADLDLTARAILAIGEECARLLLNDPGGYSPERLVEFAARLAANLSAQRVGPTGRRRARR